MQLILLKDLLLLGGTVRYGMRISGLLPPPPPPPGGGVGPTTRWQGRLVPCVREAGEGAHEQDAAARALEFQKLKAYEAEFEGSGNKSKLFEKTEVDLSFVGGGGGVAADAAAAVDAGEELVAFDAYLIGEGGWSDSTRKLGFNKVRMDLVLSPVCTSRLLTPATCFDQVVTKANPRIGLVCNLDYDVSNPEEKAMKSRIWHALQPDWPLKECVLLTEFLEYLKGESHFLAAVVMLENKYADKTAEYFEQARGSDTPAEALASMEALAALCGLVEIGVIRKKLPRQKLLQPENVDADALTRMARLIATEIGLPASTTFCKVNPVQLFDFSSLARCERPLKLLTAGGKVVDATADGAASAGKIGDGCALVCPIGDALQEPVWTSGLGVNRGFHGGLNAVYTALCARHRGVPAACVAADKAWGRMLAINWPCGLPTDYRKGCCVKPGEKWTADPMTRL